MAGRPTVETLQGSRYVRDNFHLLFFYLTFNKPFQTDPKNKKKRVTFYQTERRITMDSFIHHRYGATTYSLFLSDFHERAVWSWSWRKFSFTDIYQTENADYHLCEMRREVLHSTFIFHFNVLSSFLALHSTRPRTLPTLMGRFSTSSQ
jgi:hypothetical protein